MNEDYCFQSVSIHLHEICQGYKIYVVASWESYFSNYINLTCKYNLGIMNFVILFINPLVVMALQNIFQT